MSRLVLFIRMSCAAVVLAASPFAIAEKCDYYVKVDGGPWGCGHNGNNDDPFNCADHPATCVPVSPPPKTPPPGTQPGGNTPGPLPGDNPGLPKQARCDAIKANVDQLEKNLEAAEKTVLEINNNLEDARADLQIKTDLASAAAPDCNAYDQLKRARTRGCFDNANLPDDDLGRLVPPRHQKFCPWPSQAELDFESKCQPVRDAVDLAKQIVNGLTQNRASLEKKANSIATQMARLNDRDFWLRCPH